jgi:hypothetical protein
MALMFGFSVSIVRIFSTLRSADGFGTAAAAAAVAAVLVGVWWLKSQAVECNMQSNFGGDPPLATTPSLADIILRARRRPQYINGSVEEINKWKSLYSQLQIDEVG